MEDRYSAHFSPGDGNAVMSEGIHVTQSRVDVDGSRVSYWEAGSGPSVVLVHGIASAAEYWAYTIGPLSARHRVIALDVPGFGFSDRIPDTPSLEGIARLLIRFFDVVGIEQPSLIGNSMGGAICLETALRYPNRVNRLILSNSFGLGREIHPFWRMVRIPLVGVMVVEANRRLALRNRANMFYSPRWTPTEIAQRIRAWVARPDLTRTMIEIAETGLDLRGQRAEVIRIDSLRSLTVPTLIVWGRNDWVIPALHGERAAFMIPNARCVVFDRCGHCPQLECPDEFNRVALSFLGGE